jgi:hypothetical protein
MFNKSQLEVCFDQMYYAAFTSYAHSILGINKKIKC